MTIRKINPSRTYLSILVSLGLALSACSKSPEHEEVMLDDTEMTEDVADAEETKKPAVSKALSSYIPLTSEDGEDILLPVFVAKKPTPMPEDEMLRLFSGEYNSEPDAFKRRDLAAQIRPDIDKQLDKHASHEAYSIPMAGMRFYYEELRKDDKRNMQSHGFTPILPCESPTDCAKKVPVQFMEKKQLRVMQWANMQPYDFDRKGFKVTRGPDPLEKRAGITKDHCLPTNVILHNKQKIPLTIEVGDYNMDEVCFIPIKDENIARAIEGDKSKYSLQGTLLLNVTGGDNSLIGTIEGVTWDIQRNADPDKGEFNTFGTSVVKHTNRL